MDSFQQPHGYMRPPPPPPHTADPHHSQFHQIQPPRQPAPPPQGPWFSSQFQYHPSQTPSPPPQWAPPPPPHSDHFPPSASYLPHSNPYPPPHSYHHNQFPPPPPPSRPHVPTQFPPHSHIPQSYPQEWNTPSWPPNQSWDYTAHKNEEDWAARARAWADAKAAMESQHPQSQFSPAGRLLQEQNHYHDQYHQSVDSRYPDIQNQSHPSSSYPQFSVSDASMQRLPGPQQEAASVSSETSYTSDAHLSYSARDGTSTGDPTVSFQHQGNLPTNPSVHQQEVPSSYSSVAGKDAADKNQQSYTMFHLPNSSSQEQQHLQPSMQAPFASGSHSVDPAISLADQPLDFAPRFNREGDLQMQSTYGHHDSATSIRGIDPVSGVPSINSWAPPVAPGVAYPPIPPVLASGPQHDPSITTPVPGHVAPAFGRFPGSGLAPTIPPGGAPFALNAGTAIHPTTAFSADAYGVSGVLERPKKASVPNWLREEIKKAVIAAPSVEHSKEESKFMDDDAGKSYVKGDEPDRKSIDSSRSAEEEEDEEDYVEEARSAAINQEIKRVLTEVLLKVTDELFDEIATKVLSEDDMTSEVIQNAPTSNHKASTSPPSAPVPKASAKVLVPVKAKEPEPDAASEKTNSSSPGDVLGLGNYASDADDGDDEMNSSSMPPALNDAAHQSVLKKSLENMHDASSHCSSQLKIEENGRIQTNSVNNLNKTSSSLSKTSNGSAIGQLHDDKVTKKMDHSHPSKVVSEDRDTEVNAFERRHDRSNGKTAGIEKTIEDPQFRESRIKTEKADRRDKTSSEDFAKDVQKTKVDENHRRKDERHQRKEKADDINEAKERVKDHNVRHGEKAKESESRKRSSHVDVRSDNKEAEKAHRGSAMEDSSRRKEHTRDKGEHRSRHKDASKSDRHKRRRSSSVSSRGRSSRDQAVTHTSESSGEGSDGSKRKMHSRKRDLSPSPVRSRRRQVSRSPHSKHSQRRHSPYSSLDISRGKRSRSRSPVRYIHTVAFLFPAVLKRGIVEKLELWSIWLSGFVLIVLSLYTTQRLPSLKDQIQSKTPNTNSNAISDSSITIFTAPKPFTGSTATRQTLAVRSWLALSPHVTVVLYSQHSSVASFAHTFGSRVLVNIQIDFTFLGTPFFHSMIAKSRSFASDIFVIVDPETIILSGLISTLNYAHQLHHDWLLIASSPNVSSFPFHLDESGKHWHTDNGKRMHIQELQQILQQNWQWNHCDMKMLIAWNNRDVPLHNGVLPPFLFGKGIHNSWIIHEAMSSEFRFVIDASWTITSFHLSDQDDFHPKVEDSAALDMENTKWEYLGNSHLGTHYGSFFFNEANYSSLLKLFKCGNQYILLDPKKNAIYPIGHPDCFPKDKMILSAPMELPFSLESILSITADKNKTIILAVAGYSYKDMLMSWVCRMRRLSIANFAVCALDQETYQFSILQGIPVFRDPIAPRDISYNDCHFGTKCFQRVTKVKSRIVLKILKLGYNVLLSDVDIYWFKNPVPLLSSFGPAVLAAQSDEFNKQGSINLPRRLNSGFYYAHSDGQTISAMEKVVKHAAISGLSEQPSFYDMLCGEGGIYRAGDNTCVEPETNLTVHFLDRDLFPNGAYLDLWQEKDVKAACLKKGCLIIHNNWISGRLKKLERQILSGLVEHTHKDAGRKNQLRGSKGSPDLSLQGSKDIYVRIVHAGGKQEWYEHAILASKLMEKYPGMCVARPEVFKSPYQSVLWPEERLIVGQKYFIISFRDVEKLKRKLSGESHTRSPNGLFQELLTEKTTRSPNGHKVRENGTPNEVGGQEELGGKTYVSPSRCKVEEKSKIKEVLDAKVNESVDEEICFSSAKDFYVCKEKPIRYQKRKGIKGKKPFVPPLPKSKLYRGLGWQPSLPAVQELSP
ncbi:rhamnogalacturonan II specific xylosyltransferase [Senna tora]|uniref:Rhamnogalacturonan II specific xylosyltransferase n=1 Tax=Senna tora TaxID=362788 RepID=A0A834SV91_9FABA|nr:rhamnogalacturonan II specific xylosyltransferase [Senna tora]